jgi:hypothetical protein
LTLPRCRTTEVRGMSSSADNRRVLVVGLALTASRRASESTVTGRSDRGSSSRLVSPSLNLLNQFCAVRFETTPSRSTSHIFFAASVALKFFFSDVEALEFPIFILLWDRVQLVYSINIRYERALQALQDDIIHIYVKWLYWLQ